jgi:type II secretory pathway component PulF
MNLSEKASLYRELAKLVGASFHLDRTLGLLLGQNPSHARRTWLEGLQMGLAAGLSVAEAVEKHNAAFSGGLEITLISAGERSGRLADAFGHLARYFEAWELGLRRMRSAMIYPLVLVHLGVMLPELPAIVTAGMQDGGEEHPVRRLVLTLVLLWLVVILLAILWRWLSKKGIESAAVESWLWRIPLIGSVRRHWALARFSQVFHACLLAGMRMTECMMLSGEAAHSGLLRQAATDASKKISQGEMIGGAMADVHGFPITYVHSVATAEEAGTLDREMNSWAAAEMIEAQEALQRASNWVPKLFYAGVVLYVAYRILQMVSSYYGEIRQQLEAL